MTTAEIMSKPCSCTPDTNLAVATELLLNEDCGVLPVVDPTGKLLGVATDRDLCIALGTRNRRAAELTMAEVISREVHACKPDDSLEDALATMAAEQVRRLPVTDERGHLLGMVSINDIILQTQPGGKRRGGNNSLSAEKVMEALRSICAHRQEKAKSSQAA